MQILYLTGLLLLIIVQVNSSPPFLWGDKKITTNRVVQWAKDKAQMLINEIQDSTGNLKSTLDKHMTDGHSNIEKITTAALHDLNTQQQLISPECYQQNVAQLESVKNASFWEFFNCKNLTEAVHNIDHIIHKTANITRDILGYVEHGLSGSLECKRGDYFDDAECGTNYIWSLIKNVRKAIPQVKTYGGQMKELSDKIKAEIDYCLHPPLKQINSQVKFIMEESRKCATQTSQNVSSN
uniref:Putative secreted protein n=1 Tax=Panstrongylus lignarius TaxID=156445 RepID=A0A224XJ07_9HEMI